MISDYHKLIRFPSAQVLTGHTNKTTEHDASFSSFMQ